MNNETCEAFNLVMEGLEKLMEKIRQDGKSSEVKAVRFHYDAIDGIRDAMLTKA